VTPEQIRVLIEAHVTAVLERLKEDAELSDAVFEGDVDGNPERYVNVHHDTGSYSSHDFADQSVDVAVTFTIHSVGMSRWQAVWTSGRVTGQLLRFIPAIEGRRCFRMEPVGTQPVTLDRDVTPPKHFAVDRFVLRSIPA
jgi:hypothetical protein